MLKIKEHFQTEGCASYRPLPFWSWNDKLEKKKLIDQIHWMCENGIGGFFMHARSGLQTEYMSDEWMACIEACEKEAAKLKMKAWLYDENGWPSGFAGGKLLEKEENRDRYIVYKKGAYDSLATVSYLLTEEELLRVSDGEVEGEYLNLYIHTSTSTADILNPDVVRKFLDLTHEKYKERYGEQFSKRIEGFFTDEPQYYRWKTPYTDVIAQYYKDEYQEDILDGLGLLFVEKKGYRAFRYRYWKTMQQLMLRGFAEQIYRWCDTNSVKLTGHYVEEFTLGAQLMCCGGIMPFYEYEHVPGVDWLGKTAETELPAKQVESVAAQLGKKQVLTETFGCCGWDVLPSELRRILSFQYVNGINMLCHHLVPYSERGNRKYDHPAHYSTINPWVKEEFKSFNDYYTKLGYLLGEGKKHVNVAVLHPLRSAYFDYKRELEAEGFGVQELDEKLSKSLRTLSARGIEYHLLDETLLAKYGFVDEKRIGCGQCTYDYLVIPPILTMDQTTEALLRRYVMQGGKVLLLGPKPAFLEAEEYHYEYLKTNTCLEEIMSVQKYHVEDYETDIYSTYRTMEDRSYLYVVNRSTDTVQSQRFTFDSDVKSFIKIDLTDLSEQVVPLTITLRPGEDALLFLSEKEVAVSKILQPYELQFENANISVEENYLPVDMICYSTDGKTFSKPWPCAALFQKLLRERYQGELFLNYEFEIETLPEKLFIRTEKSNDIAAWMNGNSLNETVSVEDGYINTYDVSALAKLGKNTYTVQVNWFEKEDVYFALFGENVTESLKNCIVYDTELQPIELVGSFGVYPREGYVEDVDARFVRGQDFYIGKLPQRVTQPSTEGFPFFAGKMTLSQNFTFDTIDILLRVSGEYQMASVKVNEKEAGKLFFEKELDISHVASLGMNKIEVEFVLGNRNRMGPHHLIANKDESITPWSFELSGAWEDDRSRFYHVDYDIKRF